MFTRHRKQKKNNVKNGKKIEYVDKNCNETKIQMRIIHNLSIHQQ